MRRALFSVVAGLALVVGSTAADATDRPEPDRQSLMARLSDRTTGRSVHGPLHQGGRGEREGLTSPHGEG
jgi:hypothetical protein